MFIKVLSVLIAGISAQSNEFSEVNMDNPVMDLSDSIDLTRACDSISDCYNCTLSNCLWQASACSKKSANVDENSRPPLTVKDFFNMGQECQDTEKRCKKMVPEGDGKLTNFTFS